MDKKVYKIVETGSTEALALGATPSQAWSAFCLRMPHAQVLIQPDNFTAYIVVVRDENGVALDEDECFLPANGYSLVQA